MSNVTTSNAPDKALAKANMELYKLGMLDAMLKGINTTFMIITVLAIISLIISFFLKDKKKNNNIIENNNEEQIA